jgi:hypothetical protein
VCQRGAVVVPPEVIAKARSETFAEGVAEALGRHASSVSLHGLREALREAWHRGFADGVRAVMAGVTPTRKQ